MRVLELVSFTRTIIKTCGECPHFYKVDLTKEDAPPGSPKYIVPCCRHTNAMVGLTWPCRVDPAKAPPEKCPLPKAES